MDILTQIDQLKAEIDVLRPIDPVREQRIMQKLRLDWTYHSNKLEGNSLTYGETENLLLNKTTAAGRPLRDSLEIRGHHRAIDNLLEIIKHGDPLTEVIIRELHKIILVEPYKMSAQTDSGQRTTRLTTPGKYKDMPNHVQTRSGEMYYYASPEETPARMAELLAWYRRKQGTDEHPLNIAAAFHYAFVKIHPFDDGNGRLARLLMNLILMQSGFPPLVIHTDTREGYLLSLRQADKDDDLEPFINLTGNSLIESMKLWLRGARGENIEELDDLDKKLALLEVKMRGKEIEKEHQIIEQEQIKTWIANEFKEYVVAPFFAKLFPQLAKFSKFFEKTSIAPSLDLFIQQIGEETQHQIWQIRYQWKGIAKDHQYTLTMLTQIWLEDEEFSIECVAGTEHGIVNFLNHSSLLNGRYGYIPTEHEMENAIKKVTNDIYQLIEQKINSTD